MDPTDFVKPGENPYLIGVGRADCTGPVADVPLVSRVYSLYCISINNPFLDGGIFSKSEFSPRSCAALCIKRLEQDTTATMSFQEKGQTRTPLC